MTIQIDLERWQWIFYFTAVIVAIFLVIWFYKTIKHFFRKQFWPRDERGEIIKRWQEIQTHLESGVESGYRLAILEADKLLDHALKQKFMPGNTLAERLKYAVYKYPNLRRVWWAHKVRNDLAHESTFTLSEKVAKQAIKSFEEALRELGAL